MPINFPASPTNNQLYTYLNNTWVWNTKGWEKVSDSYKRTDTFVINYFITTPPSKAISFIKA